MKLVKGESYLQLPPVGMFEGAYFEIGGSIIASIQNVRMSSLTRMRKENDGAMGRPTWCAFGHESGLQIYPAADKDYEIKVKYYPPMVEI